MRSEPLNPLPGFATTFLKSPLQRREVYGLGLAAYALPLLSEAVSLDAATFASNWHRLNILVMFAIAVCAFQIWKAAKGQAASRLEVAALGVLLPVVLGMSALGFGRGIGAPFSAFAAVLFWQARNDMRLRAATMVMLALAANGFWGPAFFTFFGQQILAADAYVLSSAFSIASPDVTTVGTAFVNPNGFSIVLVGSCSVFNALTAAVLAYTALAVSERGSLISRDIWGLAIIGFGLLMLNTFRLILTAQSRENYVYWHDGEGFSFLEMGQTLAILVACLVAVNVIREHPPMADRPRS